MKKYAKIKTTALSSKGQIVLPKVLRENMSLEAGSKFLIFSDGENILLKPVQDPDLREFDSLVSFANTWAKEKGMKKSDIADAIQAVRSEEYSPFFKQNIKSCV